MYKEFVIRIQWRCGWKKSIPNQYVHLEFYWDHRDVKSRRKYCKAAEPYSHLSCEIAQFTLARSQPRLTSHVIKRNDFFCASSLHYRFAKIIISCVIQRAGWRDATVDVPKFMKSLRSEKVMMRATDNYFLLFFHIVETLLFM